MRYQRAFLPQALPHMGVRTHVCMGHARVPPVKVQTQSEGNLLGLMHRLQEEELQEIVYLEEGIVWCLVTPTTVEWMALW